jgi:D-hydantoinase
MLDLIVRGGRVVTLHGVGDWDIGIHAEKIVALAEPGTLTEAGRVIDATGKIVIPGGVEAHTHIGSPLATQPGSGIMTSGPEPVSRAALFGGTTFVTDFAIARPGVSIPAALEERHACWKGQSYCDYSYHVTMAGEITADHLAQMKDAVAAGFVTFKMFTTSVRPVPPGVPSNRIDFGRIFAVMTEAEKLGAVCPIHAEDEDIVQYNYQRHKELNEYEWWRMADVHTRLSEELSFHRTIAVAARTGAAAYFVHTSARDGVEAIAEARSRGLPIYGETLHNYVTFDQENYKEPDGMKYHTYPSLKTKPDRDRLWDGLLHGDMSIMATDHISTPYKVKIMGRTVADVSGGHNGVETRVGVTYTEAVTKRGMSLERFAQIVSTNPAKLLGLYPRKGAIAPGSDADLCLLDPNVKRTLGKQDFHLEDYSIWEGWQVSAWPAMTILRGKVAVENGKLSLPLGAGQLTPRRVSAEVLSGRAC